MISGTRQGTTWYFECADLNELRAAFPIYAWRFSERGRFEVEVPQSFLVPQFAAHDEIVLRGATSDGIAAALRSVGQLPMSDQEVEAAKRR